MIAEGTLFETKISQRKGALQYLGKKMGQKYIILATYICKL